MYKHAADTSSRRLQVHKQFEQCYEALSGANAAKVGMLRSWRLPATPAAHSPRRFAHPLLIISSNCQISYGRGTGCVLPTARIARETRVRLLDLA